MENREISVTESIRKRYRELFSAEKKAADYILKNPGETIALNISELAQKSGTSEASVVRMCKHVGYQGYYQMRLLMSHDMGKKRVRYQEEEIPNSSRSVFGFSASRIEALSETIDMDLLIKSAKILRGSRQVHVVAAGNTSPIAMDLGFRLERCGIACTYAILPEHFLNHVSLGTSDDTAVLISRSGASKQVVQAMELARKNKMHLIVISGESKTQLAEYADCVLRIEDKQAPFPEAIEPTSHLCEMAISDALLYVIKNFDVFAEGVNNKRPDRGYDEVELLLTEYKL